MDRNEAKEVLSQREPLTLISVLLRPGVWIITPLFCEWASNGRLKATLGYAWWGLLALFILGAVRYAAIALHASWQGSRARRVLRELRPELSPQESARP